MTASVMVPTAPTVSACKVAVPGGETSGREFAQLRVKLGMVRPPTSEIHLRACAGIRHNYENRLSGGFGQGVVDLVLLGEV